MYADTADECTHAKANGGVCASGKSSHRVKGPNPNRTQGDDGHGKRARHCTGVGHCGLLRNAVRRHLREQRYLRRRIGVLVADAEEVRLDKR